MDNINDIIASLSEEDIEMLKGVASSILGEEEKAPPPKQNALASLGGGLGSDDLQMIMRAKQIFDKMHQASSKNADLINALKPHLSERSRRRADEAIRIMQLFEALPYIKDLF